MKPLDMLIVLLKNLMQGRFFGRVEVIFNAGKIVHVKKEESIKFD